MEFYNTSVLCLICGEGDPPTCSSEHFEVKQEVEDKSESTLEHLDVHSTVWSSEDKLIYDCFLKYFRVRSRWQQIHKLQQWKGTLPFCGLCKGGLFRIAEWQLKLEEIVKNIQKEVATLKQKLEDCEEKFTEKSVYEKDPRYKRMRSLMVANWFKIHRHRGAKRKTKQRSLSLDQIMQHANVEELVKHEIDEFGPSVEDIVYPEEPVDIPGVVECSQSTNTYNDKPTGGTGDQNIYQELVHKPKNSRQRTGRASAHQQKNNTEQVFKAVKLLKKGNDPVQEPKLLPSSEEPRSKRKRQSTKLYGDAADDALIDQVVTENPAPVPKPSKKPPPKRGKPKNPRRSNGDADWTLSDDSSCSNESQTDDEPDINEDTGGNRYYKIIENPDGSTISYHHFTFIKLEDGQVQCERCSKTVARNNRSLMQHINKYHYKKFVCKSCDTSFATQTILKRHIKSAHLGMVIRSTERGPCNICQRPTILYQMKLHLWTHKSQEERDLALSTNDSSVPAVVRKKHKCNICNAEFAKSNSLRYHLTRVHGPQTEKELCPECGKTVTALKTHLRDSHTTTPKFVCLEQGKDGKPCGKKFTIISHLRKHKDAVHRKAKPWKCEICERSFGTEKHYKLHRDSHSGIRPWQCDQCEIGFLVKAHLQRHQKIYHSGQKTPRRKPFQRGPTTLKDGKTKNELIAEGKYLPPSALATWAAGREPTSHFPQEYVPKTVAQEGDLTL